MDGTVAEHCQHTIEWLSQTLAKEVNFEFWSPETISYDWPQVANSVTAPRLLLEFTRSIELLVPKQHSADIICAKVFKAGDLNYRCSSCGMDDTCVMCAECFHSSHGKISDESNQHEVSCHVVSQDGGCCDCGDEEAWKRPLGCQIHVKSSDTSQENPLETAARLILKHKLQSVIDYVIQALGCWAFTPQSAPSALLSPPEATDFDDDDEIIMILWNDERHNFDEVEEVVTRASPLDMQKYTEPESYGTFVAKGVDTFGRQAIVHEKDLGDQLLFSYPYTVTIFSNLTDLLGLFHTIGLSASLCKKKDYFHQETAAYLVRWLAKFVQSSGVVAQCVAEILQQNVDTLAKVDIGHDFSQLLENHFKEHIKDSWFTKTIHIPTDPTISSLAKLDLLLMLDIRLWKSVRSSLKSIYVTSLLRTPESKIFLAERYALAYWRITNDFMINDREPPLNIAMMSVQLFTVPSIAAHLVMNFEMIQRMFHCVVIFFISGANIAVDASCAEQVRSQILRMQHSLPLDCSKNRCFSNHRYLHITKDMDYIFSHGIVKQSVATIMTSVDTSTSEVTDWQTSMSESFASFVVTFCGLDPMKRQEGEHVVFESTWWHNLFSFLFEHATIIAKFLGLFEATEGLCFMMHRLELFIEVSETVDGVEYNVVPYRDTRTTPVSFHHQHVLAFTQITMRLLLNSHEKHSNWFKAFCSSVDPLRLRDDRLCRHMVSSAVELFSLLGQIDSNMWVLNGISARNQALNYRGTALRDTALDIDLAALQIVFAFGPEDFSGDHVICCVLIAFDSLAWLDGSWWKTEYKPDRKEVALQESMLLLLIHMACHNFAFVRSSMQPGDELRMELIQILAAGPLTYSKLVRRLPERLSESQLLDSTLNTVAILKTTDGLDFSSRYELKPEFAKEYNPYYFHTYPSHSAETFIDASNPAISTVDFMQQFQETPSYMTSLPTELFALQAKFVESKLVLKVVEIALKNNMEPTLVLSHLMIDQALHLIAAMMHASRVYKKHEEFMAALAVNCLDMFSHMMQCDIFKEHHSKLESMMRFVVEHASDEVATRAKNIISGNHDASGLNSPGVDSAAEQKRQEAKQRQARIMAQFAKAQSTFVSSHADEFADFADEDYDIDNSALPEDLNGKFYRANFEKMELSNFTGTCIICQEHVASDKAFGSPGFIQASGVLRYEKYLALANASPRERPKYGLFASTCGHVIHLQCAGTLNRTNVGDRERPKEFACPLCKGLANTLIPMPAKMSESLNTAIEPCEYHTWIDSINDYIAKNESPSFEKLYAFNLQFNMPIHLLEYSTAQVGKPLHSLLNPKDNTEQHLSIVSNVSELVAACFASGVVVNQKTEAPDSPDSFHSAFVWGLTKPTHTCSELYSVAGYATWPIISYVITMLHVQEIKEPIKLSSQTQTLLTCLAEAVRTRLSGDNLTQLRLYLLAHLSPTSITYPGQRIPTLYFDPFEFATFVFLFPLDDTLCQTELGSSWHHIFRQCAIFEMCRAVIKVHDSFLVGIRNEVEPLWASGRDNAESEVHELLLARANTRTDSHKLVSHLVSFVRLVIDGIYEGMVAQIEKTDLSTNSSLLKIPSNQFLVKRVLKEKALFLQTLDADQMENEMDKTMQMFLNRTLTFLKYALHIQPKVSPHLMDNPYAALQLPEDVIKLCSEINSGHYVETVKAATNEIGRHFGFSLLEMIKQVSISVAPKTPMNMPPIALSLLPFEHMKFIKSEPPVLYDLPKSYNTLLEEIVQRNCVDCGSRCVMALCLICGAKVCTTCGENEIQDHQFQCGIDVGIWFVVKRCIIALVGSTHSRYISAPYEDSHGESNAGLQRSVRMFLNEKRYKQLEKLYVSHGIPNFVSQQHNAAADTFTDWQLI